MNEPSEIDQEQSVNQVGSRPLTAHARALRCGFPWRDIPHDCFCLLEALASFIGIAASVFLTFLAVGLSFNNLRLMFFTTALGGLDIAGFAVSTWACWKGRCVLGASLFLLSALLLFLQFLLPPIISPFQAPS
jgi:hypothetical protein